MKVFGCAFKVRGKAKNGPPVKFEGMSEDPLKTESRDYLRARIALETQAEDCSLLELLEFRDEEGSL
jgi:hypothetical protein